MSAFCLTSPNWRAICSIAKTPLEFLDISAVSSHAFISPWSFRHCCQIMKFVSRSLTLLGNSKGNGNSYFFQTVTENFNIFFLMDANCCYSCYWSVAPLIQTNRIIALWHTKHTELHTHLTFSLSQESWQYCLQHWNTVLSVGRLC